MSIPITKPLKRLIFPIIIVLFGPQLFAGQSAHTPVMHLDQTTHMFPISFEGEQLSHSFKLTNQGTADLEIWDVTHTWGCIVTRHDRVIPPGGTGQITLAIDTSKEIDEFQKKVIVLSNDPQRKRVALYLTGEVKPHISLVPGGYLSLQGARGRVPAEKLEIINNHRQPFKITGVVNKLPNHIKWALTEIKTGYSYTLEVEDISKKPGEFNGHLIVQTDQPQKPELVIIVSGYIEAN